MRNFLKKIFRASLVILPLFVLVSCKTTGSSSVADSPRNLRFAYPDGTPALSIARLGVDNKKIADSSIDYNIVSASLISREMATDSADLVIMPVNGGANLIRQGAEYKLATVAVDGSLFAIGAENISSVEELRGKKVACIGQQGTPGLITRYVLNKKNIVVVSKEAELTTDNVYVQYVADAAAARTLLAAGNVEFAIVGEPAATAVSAALSSKGIAIRIDMQAEYKDVVNNENITTYPQAGLFVKNSIADNEPFMTELYAALVASKTWVLANPGEVTDLLKNTLGSSSAFPVASIKNCAVNATKLTDTKKTEVIQFLQILMPKDGESTIDWTSVDLFA